MAFRATSKSLPAVAGAPHALARAEPRVASRARSRCPRSPARLSRQHHPRLCRRPGQSNRRRGLPQSQAFSPRHPEPEPTFSRSGAGFDPTATAAAANAAADLLAVIVAPYLFPDAEEDYKKRIKQLQDELQPTIEARISELLKNETRRIAELGSSGSKLFVTVRVAVWIQNSDVQGAPGIPVGLDLDDVKLSTKNINETELSHSLADAARCTELGGCRSYQIYSFPVPSALQQQAVRQFRDAGSSNLKSFNNLANSLKDSSYKIRLAGAQHIQAGQRNPITPWPGDPASNPPVA